MSSIPAKVLDISRYQISFDAEKAKREGIDGVMVRAGYGLGPDSCFYNFAAAAKKAGLPVGSYLFATWHYASVSPDFETAKANAKQQADYFVSLLKQAPVNSFAALDLELEQGQNCNLSPSQLSVCANLFLDVLKRSGHPPLLYCSIAWLYEKMDAAQLKYPFWIACYHEVDADFSSQPPEQFPATRYGEMLQQLYQNKRLAMWQFGSVGGGTAYGCGSVNVDKNWAYVPLVKRGFLQTLGELLQGGPFSTSEV